MTGMSLLVVSIHFTVYFLFAKLKKFSLLLLANLLTLVHLPHFNLTRATERKVWLNEFSTKRLVITDSKSTVPFWYLFCRHDH